MTFSRLVRYSLNGQSSYGDLLESTQAGHVVRKLNGNSQDGFTQTTQTVTVEKVWALPLRRAGVANEKKMLSLSQLAAFAIGTRADYTVYRTELSEACN